MKEIIVNVGCSIVAGVVLNTYSKFPLVVEKRKKALLEKINKLVKSRIDESNLHISDSSTFRAYMESPQVYDLIKDYGSYVISGNLSNELKVVKHKSKKEEIKISEDAVIDYLAKNCKEYYTNQLSIPTNEDFRQFISIICLCANEIILKNLSDDDKKIIYFINKNMNSNFNTFFLEINRLSNKLNNFLDVAYTSTIRNYEKVKEKYMETICKNFENGFIYLLGEYKFTSFYVPPTITLRTKDDTTKKNIPFELLLQLNNVEDIHMIHEYKPSWKDIFLTQDIVYVVGGAGFGKTLFLKNLVNNLSSLNLSYKNDYLIIYCELKSFYAQPTSDKKSILEFLQSSIIELTGIDKTDITKDFITYYLNIGRCIILFDALDEVIKENRKNLHNKIISFFQSYNPNNKICITSRDRGFIPADNIQIFQICSLNKNEINAYVDNIIKLGKFKKDDKPIFMQQAEILIKKQFLNNFLVLSLLINIYKAEKELPENKVDLYKKCFEYIARKREEEKSKTAYEWDLIVPMMKDSTFIELSKLAAPNNIDISEMEIKNKLLTLYNNKYHEEVRTEKAINEFLEFCSSRTELIVPSPNEYMYKFFHRSFFEYFYSKHIYRINEIEKIYDSLLMFDIDSEVHELTVAMIKEEDETKYQNFMRFVIEKVKHTIENETFTENNAVFNILTIVMQVVDDEVFLRDYLDIIFELHKKNSLVFETIRNNIIISNVVCKLILKDIEYKEKFISNFRDIYYTSLLSFMPTIAKFLKAEIVFSGAKDENYSFLYNLFNRDGKKMRFFFYKVVFKRVLDGEDIVKGFLSYINLLRSNKKTKKNILNKIEVYEKNYSIDPDFLIKLLS